MVSNKEIIYEQYNNMKREIETDKIKPTALYFEKKYDYLFFHARSTFDLLYKYETVEAISILDNMMNATIKIYRGESKFEDVQKEFADKLADRYLPKK